MANRNLNDWLSFQLTLNPKEIELGLNRILNVWRKLGKPKPAKKIISIAGTNGKGSCVAILESILCESKYKVGSYTSPHLQTYNERIKINRTNSNSNDLCIAFSEIEKARGDTPLTFFEFGTLAAILIFSRAELDIAIMEIGLGGRLDAVNIIDADVAIITSIGLDHTEWLGKSTEQIGEEKAGIMRTGRPIVFGSINMPLSIEKKAKFLGAKLYRNGFDFHSLEDKTSWNWYSKKQSLINLPKPSLMGSYQIQNAATSLEAVNLLSKVFPVEESHIHAGLKKISLNGRFDVHQRKCKWILDVAHNLEATIELINQFKKLDSNGNVHAVIGIFKDKPISKILLCASAVITHWNMIDMSDHDRGSSASNLIKKMPSAATKNINTWDNVDTCLKHVEKLTLEDDIVLIFGSFVTVGRALSWMNKSLVDSTI